MKTKQLLKVGLAASLVAWGSLSAVWAEDAAMPEMMDVVASGVGMNETEATKDALGNAVRQAIGAIVGTDTLVQNEEVVRDQILTYSDGFAQNYDIVGKPSTTPSGLTTVTVRARIVRSKLIQKAKAANIAVVEVDGKGMFAEAVTKMEQNQSATALLLRELSEMPTRLIKTEIVGKPVYNDKTKTIQVAVQTSVDRAAYDSLVQRILPILDGIATESFALGSSDAKIYDYKTQGSCVDTIIFNTALFPGSYLNNYQNREQSSIMMCVRANQGLYSTQWKVFMVDKEVLDQINNELRPVSLSVNVMGINDVILDSHYTIIGEKERSDERMAGGPLTFDEHHDHRLIIYPGLADEVRLGRWSVAKLLFTGPLSQKSVIDFHMFPDQLKEISQIVCKVAPAGVPEGE